MLQYRYSRKHVHPVKPITLMEQYETSCSLERAARPICETTWTNTERLFSRRVFGDSRLLCDTQLGRSRTICVEELRSFSEVHFQLYYSYFSYIIHISVIIFIFQLYFLQIFAFQKNYHKTRTVSPNMKWNNCITSLLRDCEIEKNTCQPSLLLSHVYGI